jgi:TonB-linked SusC/RagA family outer membrane protein
MQFKAHSPLWGFPMLRSSTKTLFVMKLTIALLTVACLQVSARGASQNISINANGAPLKTIFKSIEKQTQYIFFYKPALLEAGSKVTLHIKDMPVKEALDQCFKDQPFIYYMEGRIITIEPKLLPSPASPAEEQPAEPLPAELHGRVTDSSGVPLPGVSIKLRGTRGGTTTGADGSFTIRAKPGDVLLISSTGYESRQVTVGQAANLSIVLTKSTQELATVVVTALGIKREARSLGYATAQIDNKDLNATQPVNFATGITGKVSGMDIAQTNSGVDPDNVRITLRGNRSFLGNNEPLLVVDGIPVDISYLAQINSTDIASVNILKGATASALYGSEAANGVIIVTTRSGTKRPVIQYSSTLTLDKVSFLPKEQEKFGSASNEFTAIDAISYSNPANNQNGYVPYENQAFGSPFSGGSPFGGDSIILGFPGPNGQIQKVAYKGQPNSVRDFWNTGTTFRNGVSYAQGDDNSNFFLSGENIVRTGIIPKDQFNRTTFRVNASKRYGIFKASGNVSYGESNLNATNAVSNFYVGIQNAAPQVPLNAYQNTNATFGDLNTYYNAYIVNPYWYIDNVRHTRNRKDLLASGDLSLDATPWLNIDFQGGIENYSYTEQFNTAAYDFSSYGLYLGNQANTLSGNQATYFANVLPQVSSNDVNNSELYTNLKINLHKQFGDFGTQLILGNSINQTTYNTLQNGSGTLLNVPGLYNVNYRSGTPTVGQETSLSRNFGNYADLSVNYKNFLFLHASGRQDQTSLLDESDRSYFYPGVDAAVVLSDVIGALKQSKVISYLKLRGGVTKTGNVNIGPYQIQNTYSVGNNFPYGSTSGLTTSGTYAKQDLKPEFTNSSEAGVEIGFLQGRINVKGTYFYEKTTDETVPVQVSNATGFGSYLENLGRMDNSGVELDLNGDVLRLGNGLRWNVGFNYTHYHNVVKNLGPVNSLAIPSSGSSNAYAVVGQPYPVLQVTDWAKDPKGRVIVDANTGLPQQSATLVNFGPTNPTQAIGITTSVFYKGFTLSAVAEYRGGNVIYNGVGGTMEVNGLSARSAMFNHSRFVYPNSVIETSPGVYVPNTSVTVNDGGLGFWGIYGYFPQSMYVTSAAFWTLRNVSLSYDLPQNLVRRIRPVQAVSVGLLGSNLLLWVPKLNTWTDPEFSEDNGNATGTNTTSEAPPTRTFGANIKVTF